MTVLLNERFSIKLSYTLYQRQKNFDNEEMNSPIKSSLLKCIVHFISYMKPFMVQNISFFSLSTYVLCENDKE